MKSWIIIILLQSDGLNLVATFFNVKMDLTQKSQCVKDFHKAPYPEYSTFYGVVETERVLIELAYDALNDISVMATYMKNAYLQALSSEKYYIICETKFWLDNIKIVALTHQALYDGNSTETNFWNHQGVV